MTYLATNLRLLRKHRKQTCDTIASALGMPRSTLNSYELGTVEPDAVRLIALATYYRLSVDRLLKQDLRTLSEFYLGQVSRGVDKLYFLPGNLNPVNPTP